MSIIFNSLGQIISFIAYLVIILGVIDIYVGLHLYFYASNKKIITVVGFSTIIFALLMLGYKSNTGEESINISTLSLIFILVEIGLVFLSKYLKGKHIFPILLVLPAYLGLIVLILYPMLFELYLSFFNLNLYTIKNWIFEGKLTFVGLKNYINVFYHSPLTEVTFWKLLLRTMVWTFVNVFFHVLGGFLIALFLNKVRFKSIYRTIIVIPWAMPQVVAVLAWRGEFHLQHGYINHLIQMLGFTPINWITDYPLLMCIITNVWLGIPFMAVIILGGLQSIPKSYYDAAAIDGASSLQKLYRITIPMLKPVLAPAITLGTLWTFNNINVIYLMTGQAGGTEQADILVTALYKAAFTYSRYSFSAAFAVMIFVILMISTYVWMKMSKGSESVY